MDFIRICSENTISGLVTIQFSRDFVKSGVIVKLYTNAYATTVYWKFFVFSSKYNKFAGFRKHIRLKHHFSNNIQVFTTWMLDFIRIYSQNRNCGLVIIQLSRDFVRSGVVVISTQMHTQVRLIDILQCSHLNTTNFHYSCSIFS